jgi:hypothetical protein
VTDEPPGYLIGMAAIQRAADAPPFARLAAAVLFSAIRDARGCDVHAARARVWLMTHGADWLCVILDSAADPHDVLARSLADEAWYARARRAAQDAPR